ncbi:MAG: hypothetical protein OK474_10685 [Thaumarchaeota archaeon]|nr:hypothetical protein [Nitrososphaerota archaeon]
MLARSNEVEEPNRGQDGAALIRDSGRARVYAVLYSFVVLMFAYVSYSEGEDLVTSFDDLAVVVVGLVALGFIAMRRRRPSLCSLGRLNNILFIMGLWMVVFSIFAFEIEAGFPEDLADEIPKVIVSTLLLINRLV